MRNRNPQPIRLRACRQAPKSPFWGPMVGSYTYRRRAVERAGCLWTERFSSVHARRQRRGAVLRPPSQPSGFGDRSGRQVQPG